MQSVVVTGSLAMDQIMRFPGSFEEQIRPEALHVLSVSFLANELVKSFGGTAGNIGYNLGLLGVEVRVLASLGKDGGEYLEHLRQVGVNTELVNVVKNDSTGSFFVITDNKDCQVAGFYPGAMAEDAGLNLPEQCDWLVVSPTVPNAMERFVEQAIKREIPYVYLPAQQIPRLSWDQLRKGLSQARILAGSDYEIGLLCEKVGLNPDQLKEQVPIVITTLGAKGSRIETVERTVEVPVVEVRAVDPTGAGDAYIAGFLAAYLENKSLEECGAQGAKMGALAAGVKGTQGHGE